jgi:hypothetical protein
MDWKEEARCYLNFFIYMGVCTLIALWIIS